MPPSRSFVIRWPGPRGRTGALTAVITHVLGRAAVSSTAGAPTKLAVVVPDDADAVERDNIVAAANAAGFTDVALVPASLAELRGTDVSEGVGLAAGAARIGMVDAPPPSSPEKTSARLSNPTIHLRRRLPTTPVQCRYSTNPPRLNSRRSGWLRIRSPPATEPSCGSGARSGSDGGDATSSADSEPIDPVAPVLALVVIALLVFVVVLARSAGDDDIDAAITTTLAPAPSAAPSTTVAATTTSSTTTVASVDTTSSSSTSTSTTSTTSTTTTTTTTTPVRVAAPGPVTLVETGLALDTGTIVPFGQDEQLVIAELASILGEPVADSGESQTEFCEGASVRFVRWGNLEVVFTNTDEGTPRRFTQWFADGHLDPTGLVTPEGLGESATVGFLEVTFPNVLDLVPAFDDDIVGIFAVVNPTTGQRFNGTTLGLDPNGVVTSLWAGDTCAAFSPERSGRPEGCPVRGSVVPSAARGRHVRTPRYQQIAVHFAPASLRVSSPQVGFSRRNPGSGRDTTPAGSRSAVPSSNCATRACWPVVKGLAGTQAATKSINRSMNWRRSSTSSPPRVSRPPGECSTFLWCCPGTGAQRSAPTACWPCAGSTSPTVSRSPGSPCGVLRRSARRSLVTMLSASVLRTLGRHRRCPSGRRQPDDRGGRCVSRRRRTPRRSHRSPVLICERTTRAADGSSVLFSEHVYPGHRMAFTVDLAPGASSDAPAGLRLVE